MPRIRRAALLVTALLLTTGTNSVAHAAPASSSVRTSSAVPDSHDFHDDQVPTVFLNAPPISRLLSAQAFSGSAAKGYLLTEPVGYTFNQPTYTLRLVSNRHGNIDAYRTAAKAVANRVKMYTGITINVAAGTIPDQEDGGFRLGRDEKDGEILVSIDPRLCGGDPSVIGCAGPASTFDKQGNIENVSGRIWLSPHLNNAADVTRQEVLAHEMGHVLGLAHFAELYQGERQRMFPSDRPVPKMYMPGDINGLLAVRPDANPIGRLDSVKQGPDGIIANGWSLDPNSSDSNSVHLYVDGLLKKSTPARNVRNDIGNAYPYHGAAHGYSVTVPFTAGEGTKKVCAYGLNVANTRGGSAGLGCATLTFKNSPSGSFDRLVVNGDRLEFGGWTIDPNTADPTRVHLYVDGVGKANVLADRTRNDLASRGYGTAHGFNSSTSKPAPGAHTVCAYAINVPGTDGSNVLLGCKTIRT